MRRGAPLPWLCLLLFCGCSPELPASPPAASTRRSDRGKALYLHYCAVCHGEGGAGDGLNAYNLSLKPRSFDGAFLASRTGPAIADAIARGGKARGLSPLMPAWGLTLKGSEIEDVAAYLRIMRAPQGGP